MARSRMRMSLADYLAIMITPLLIMILVGSVVYFLLEIGYRGQYEDRLQWILFWFVFASVLVSRIAIEQGRSAAAAYGGALALATVLVMLKFVESPAFAIALLGVIWWLIDRLTVDCTLIDDAQDASGMGLLQLSGLVRRSAQNAAQQDAQPTQGGASVETDRHPVRKKSVGHAPGVWLVYFSLAALPLFGVGQTLIPSERAESRNYAFQLLAVYCAAALGLLLTTSFLGLRRYLRQRRIPMPRRVVQSWVCSGIVLALGILVAAMLVPRPEARYSVTALLDQWSSELRDSSPHAVLSDSADHDDPRRGDARSEQKTTDSNNDRDNGRADSDVERNAEHRSPPSGAQHSDRPPTGDRRDDSQATDGRRRQRAGSRAGGQPNEDGRGDSQQSRTEQNEAEQAQSDPAAGERAGGERAGGEQAGGEQAGQVPQADRRIGALAEVGRFLAQLIKWIVYGSLGALAVWGLVANRARLLDGLAGLWAALVGLFGRGRRTPDATGGVDQRGTESSRRPFADFANPFETGQAAQLGLDGVVIYTFAALEAWADGWGWSRRSDETPGEFARRLSSEAGGLESELTSFVHSYALVVYAERSAPASSRECARSLWKRMSESTPPISAQSAAG